jgi:hypothetical protein
VGIAAHIARLRAVVGHELLLLPAVSVLPVDKAGQVLLVRHAGHDDEWGVLGGTVLSGDLRGYGRRPSSIRTGTCSVNGACGATALRIWSANPVRWPGGGS